MQQIASFADKVNTLEGAVQVGASLQVLGGPFAQFGDALGMLNEGLNDVEGLMNRFQRMFQNFGKFNKETGQVDITAFNRQRIRAAAEAMGMDYNQVMESVQAQGRRKYIDEAITQNFMVIATDRDATLDKDLLIDLNISDNEIVFTDDYCPTEYLEVKR